MLSSIVGTVPTKNTRGAMFASDLVEVLCAAHLSFHVDSPFESRGGIMLVGEPGVLKSTFLSVLDKQYHDAVTMSDINARGLADLRGAIVAGGIRTIVLSELAKLYERADPTAKNVEGTLRAMADEGFQAASFEDQRINRSAARAMIIGALTPRTQENHFKDWEDSGFNRRFLWPHIRLADPELLERAVIEWRRVDFQLGHIPRPPVSRIPNHTTVEERKLVRGWVKYQPGGSHALHVQLMTKILCVLRWWYGQVDDDRDAISVLSRFAESLGRGGAPIEIEEVSASPQKRSAERQKIRKAAISNAARQLAKSKKKGKRRK